MNEYDKLVDYVARHILDKKPYVICFPKRCGREAFARDVHRRVSELRASAGKLVLVKAYKCPECGWEFDSPVWCTGYSAEPDDDSAAHADRRAEENPECLSSTPTRTT